MWAMTEGWPDGVCEVGSCCSCCWMPGVNKVGHDEFDLLSCILGPIGAVLGLLRKVRAQNKL